MKYIVKTTVGIGFVFRHVRELDYDAEKRSLRVNMPGMEFTAHGVASIKGVEDDEPNANSFNVIGGGDGGASYEFPREAEVPIELKAAPCVDELTLSGLKQELDGFKRSFAAQAVRAVRNAEMRGVRLQ